MIWRPLGSRMGTLLYAPGVREAAWACFDALCRSWGAGYMHSHAPAALGDSIHASLLLSFVSAGNSGRHS